MRRRTRDKANKSSVTKPEKLGELGCVNLAYNHQMSPGSNGMSFSTMGTLARGSRFEGAPRRGAGSFAIKTPESVSPGEKRHEHARADLYDHQVAAAAATSKLPRLTVATRATG